MFSLQTSISWKAIHPSPQKTPQGLGTLAVQTPLRGGIAYVAPPDRHLLVSSGCIAIRDAPAINSIRPSVDLLFESLATEFGNHLIVVVLGGCLADGAIGVTKVKDSRRQCQPGQLASHSCLSSPRTLVDTRRLLSEAHAANPLIFGRIVSSSVTISESSTR